MRRLVVSVLVSVERCAYARLGALFVCLFENGEHRITVSVHPSSFSVDLPIQKRRAETTS